MKVCWFSAGVSSFVAAYLAKPDKRLNVYDAWEMENATSAALIKPVSKHCWFVTNADYAAYDTLAVVGQLKKAVSDGDMLSAEEILALQQNNGANTEGIVNPSRKLKKIWKKNRK